MPRQRQVSKTQVCFRIPIETLAAVRDEANDTGQPMSEILRSVWDLRCRMKALLPHQRLAIVEVGANKNGQASRRARVIEFVDLKKAAGNSNGRG